MNLNNMNICEISEKLRIKETTASDILQNVYNSMDESKGNFISLTKENAMESAKKVDESLSNGGDIPILAGIPIGVQDNICISGTLTTCGSKMLAEFVSPYTATAVKLIEENGGIVVGKTNMDEFGIGYTGESSYFKSVSNPLDDGYVAEGTVAAVASGEVAAAIGTSLLESAANCGVVGFKPSYQTVSRYGAALAVPSMEQISPVGKTVKDAAKLFVAIAGLDEKDPISLNVSADTLLDDIDSFNLSGLKIGLPKEFYNGELDLQVKNAVCSAVDILKGKGADTFDISLSFADKLLDVYSVLSSAEFASEMYKYDGISFGYRTEKYDGIDELYEKTRGEGFGDLVKEKILLGMYVLSSEKIDAIYNKARYMRQVIVDECNKIFDSIDVLIIPTTMKTAPKKNSGIKFYDANMSGVLADLTGIPAITVPCGKDADGMPVGMMILSKKFNDKLVLSVANRFENLCGFTL